VILLGPFPLWQTTDTNTDPGPRWGIKSRAMRSLTPLLFLFFQLYASNKPPTSRNPIRQTRARSSPHQAKHKTMPHLEPPQLSVCSRALGPGK